MKIVTSVTKGQKYTRFEEMCRNFRQIIVKIEISGNITLKIGCYKNSLVYKHCRKDKIHFSVKSILLNIG